MNDPRYERAGRRRPRRWATVVAVGSAVLGLVVGITTGATISSGGDAVAVALRAPESDALGSYARSSGQPQGDSGEAPEDGRATQRDKVPDAPPPIPDDQEEHTVAENTAEPEILQSTAGGATERTFHWHFDIPAGNILILNEFTCPSEAPYIKSNGSYRTPKKKTDVKAWHIADASIDASNGVGYAGFNSVTTTTDDDDFQLLTGWPKGSILDNNFWAPLFSAGTADLYVTCTSSAKHADVAYALPGYGAGAALPWGYH